MQLPIRFVAGGALCAALLLLGAATATAVDPDSVLIGCDQAMQPQQLTASAHLDPSCDYRRGFEILASNVTLDCQGAKIIADQDLPGNQRQRGVWIHAPQTVALANVTVRNCHVEGFLNNYHVEHEGFRQYTVENEYENAFSNILIEDSTSLNSRGVGIFVNGYVTGVTLRNLHVEGAGSTGIYLEHGSKDNVVEDSDIVNNGFRENGPNGSQFTFSGVDFWFWGTGREGLAIDGSRFNVVRNNTFSGNSDGGIFLYKNCGEFVNSRPERWWHRRYGADGNEIYGNTFVGGNNGVWIGSRMGESTLPMECSDPAYHVNALDRVVLDFARDNVVRDNDFQGVQHAIRVEDDRSTIEDNTFGGSDPAQVAILVGTRFRTPHLNQPVDETTITGNRSTIAGNRNPYRWVHGHTDTTFDDNWALERPVGFCEGVEPRRNLMIFVLAFEPLPDPDNPPTGGPPVFPPPAPLPPCAATCDSGGVVSNATVALRRLATAVGDDTLLFRGDVVVPDLTSPVLDPVATGVHVVVQDANGARALDVLVPPGAYSAATRQGWKVSPDGRRWRYTSRATGAPGGITSVAVQDLSSKVPGLIRFTVKGARGSYAVDQGALPIEGLLVLDPPTAATGQCAAATFAANACRADGRAVVCR
jgi:parallel beta-helix repeat protein